MFDHLLGSVRAAYQTTFRKKDILKKRFGQIPDPVYFHGDMEYIRAYYDFRKTDRRDAFLLDDITWTDLDLDRVFKRINPGRSTSGEQYLYYMLRSPTVKANAYKERESLIHFAESDPDRRLKLETVLSRLGCTRRADLCRAFYPSHHGTGMLVLYSVLLFLLIAAFISLAFFPEQGVIAVFSMILLNSFVHEIALRRVQSDFDTVNYSVSMVFTMQKLRKLHDPELDRHMEKAYESLDRLRPVLHTGGISTVTDSNTLGDLITTFTLLDLIAYEFLKNKLGLCHEEVFTIHEALGRLDAAIAIASYRQSVKYYAEPNLRFSSDSAPFLRAEKLVHPLLENAVPNTVDANRSMLITGSNASGKSTFLKTTALAAIMAQSICTCLADTYTACAFRICSSMALSDDLLAGESYYIVETKSLKRILDSSQKDPPILCVIDEVLRGTNTIERIAASSEVLAALADRDTLCLAATHDLELCDLLSDRYNMFHFEEKVTEQGMFFDYKLRPGKASSRNAINLLKLIGFEDEIVRKAHARADHFTVHRSWQTVL